FPRKSWPASVPKLRTRMPNWIRIALAWANDMKRYTAQGAAVNSIERDQVWRQYATRQGEILSRTMLSIRSGLTPGRVCIRLSIGNCSQVYSGLRPKRRQNKRRSTLLQFTPFVSHIIGRSRCGALLYRRHANSRTVTAAPVAAAGHFLPYR